MKMIFAKQALITEQFWRDATSLPVFDTYCLFTYVIIAHMLIIHLCDQLRINL